MLVCLGNFVHGQSKIQVILDEYNTGEVAYVQPYELKTALENVIILDTRSYEEYKISHINEAIYVGYDDFKISDFKNQFPDKQQHYVVYCSIGVRSEDVGLQLKAAGYENVQNLFGGIFEWKNHNYPVFDLQNKVTDSIHAYSKKWGAYLKRGIKVYE